MVCSGVRETDVRLPSVSTPTDDSFRAIHLTMLNIVCLSLDSDPNLIPKAARPVLSPNPHTSDGAPRANSSDPSPGVPEDEGGRDHDDFVIMSETQAKRIVSLSEIAFGVELSADVVIADANVGTLARRVVGSRSLLGGGKSGE